MIIVGLMCLLLSLRIFINYYTDSGVDDSPSHSYSCFIEEPVHFSPGVVGSVGDGIPPKVHPYGHEP